ncbi:MAG: sensor histidine kinase [Ferruginibacter sp.]|nr:sensor histidine kinase [Chitinophagaceae bacterium]
MSVKKLIILVSVITGCFATGSSGQHYNFYLNGPFSDKQRADSLLQLAPWYFLKAKFDSVDLCLKAGLPFAERSGDVDLLAGYHLMKANINSMRGKFKMGLDDAEKASPFISKKTPYTLHIKYFMTKANCFSSLDAADSAIYYYQLAEKYNIEKLPYANWAVYLAMGQLYVLADDYTEAEKYFQKAFDLTTTRSIAPENGYVLTLFMNMYTVWNKPDKAGKLLVAHNKHMIERKKAGIEEPFQNLLASFSPNSIENNLGFLTSIKEASLANGFTIQTILANSYIAAYYEKRKKYDDAIKYIKENEVLAAKNDLLSHIYMAKKMRYDLLKKTGDYAAIPSLADTLFNLKDSVLGLQKREQLYELEAIYNTEKKQKEIALLNSQKEIDAKNIALLNSKQVLADIELLRQIDIQQALARENSLMDSVVKSEKAYSQSVTREKEKEAALNTALGRGNSLKESELMKEKKLRRVLISGAGLLLLAAGVILYQYRRQRIKNVVIQKQADDMQVLMKEIHHRVKNNLQVISSLLDLQSMTIADNQASEAVKEGKNRVQSMALIHQNLYSEGNIKGIKTREYISNLLQSLCDSYNISNDKVMVKTQIDDLNLDVDTMIPLGLVLNELVSNSLKYAFKDGRPGELSIVLHKEARHLLLKVSDNGAGYPEGMNIKDSKSFGMKMIRAFAQKLKAKLDIYNSNGAVVEMQITKYNMA